MAPLTLRGASGAPDPVGPLGLRGVSDAADAADLHMEHEPALAASVQANGISRAVHPLQGH